jgi:hypothetical protein
MAGENSMKGLTILIIVTGVVAAVALISMPYVEMTRTLNSFQQVDDYPLYTMTYHGAYQFIEYVHSGAPLLAEPVDSGWSCSGFSALGSGEEDVLFGRNFDWHNRAALLLFTDPPDGHASVAMVDLGILGYRGPEDRQRLLDAPYSPIDGLNERGLGVAMMAVPAAQNGSDPDKPTIGSLQIIRLLLDQAEGVDEAVELMGKYNIDFSSGPPLHYLLADRSEHSVVVEYSGSEMHVLPAQDSWQVATNFIIDEQNLAQQQQSCTRYRTAYTLLAEHSGQLDRAEAMRLLGSIAQPNTMWSVVYNLENGQIDLAMGRDYRRVHQFKVGD